MRTRLAAGSVAAAALLTLFGSSAALADTAPTTPRTTTDPAPTPDHSRWMHDDAGRTPAAADYSGRTRESASRTSDRQERPDWMRENPLRLTTCALGTALTALTGSGRDCVADRMGIHVRAAQGARK
ncbi:hypothetical protein [Streptomyces lydicus]|uniref:Uncharacterized protein n=1 Tax=Streptomyces lydicus TaxID=47763 RepID=A0A1D7VED5_9ACTN|nr:hypothetical protein [Streptomyces lydicus]AOP44938.1 hypothetical protein SL103_00530 [Streptomyces lydicus]